MTERDVTLGVLAADVEHIGVAEDLRVAVRAEHRQVALGGGLAAAAAATGFTTLAASLALIGAADGVLLPALLAVRVRHSRTHERAAVFTTAASLNVAAGAAGAAIGGVLAGAAGADAALLAAATMHVLGALVCLGYRAA
jgi:MFS family permease